MATNSIVRARIDGHVKEQATHVLNDMGLSISDAIRMMLVRVAREKALPFDVRLPNEKTQTAMAELEADKGSRSKSVSNLMAELNVGD